MKDFVKWLGVNEKIAKVVVWIFLILIALIIVNAAMESAGFPYYKITYDNLKQIKTTEVFNYLVTWILTLSNFYSVVLLVFRTKETKRIFKYALLYLIINIILSWKMNALVQVFIIVYIIIFCYFYSGKNWKYIIYGILAYITSIAVQGIWYLSKARFIDYYSVNDATKITLTLDYFIIMAVIILVKEIYLKKRGEK